MAGWLFHPSFLNRKLRTSAVRALQNGMQRCNPSSCLRGCPREGRELPAPLKRRAGRVTLVTATMVSTSPLLNGRSCSAVPWKLYLAIHSVPDGQTACKRDRKTGPQMLTVLGSHHQKEPNLRFHPRGWKVTHVGSHVPSECARNASGGMGVMGWVYVLVNTYSHP